MTHVLDTHALVWFLERNRRLSARARAAMRDSAADLVIPTITMAEIAYLYPQKRIEIDLPRVLAHVASASNCIVYPLDEAVVQRFPPSLNIHDAIIVATALIFREVIDAETDVISRDAEITASGLVDVIW